MPTVQDRSNWGFLSGQHGMVLRLQLKWDLAFFFFFFLNWEQHEFGDPDRCFLFTPSKLQEFGRHSEMLRQRDPSRAGIVTSKAA